MPDNFDAGYEAFAEELANFLENYSEDEGVPVAHLLEFIDLSLGWDPTEEEEEA